MEQSIIWPNNNSIHLCRVYRAHFSYCAYLCALTLDASQQRQVICIQIPQGLDILSAANPSFQAKVSHWQDVAEGFVNLFVKIAQACMMLFAHSRHLQQM